jgi:hypothetical protein
MFHKRPFLTGLLAISPALVAFVGPSQAVAQQGGLPWWAWVLIVVVLLVLAFLLWWWLCRGKKEEKVAPPPRAAAPPAPDDLQRIEGIGPKISGLLQAAGIMTFSRLATADVGRLEQIVRDAGITIADPSTWPEQAGLAAAGRWSELEVLQEELKGGRRV